MREPHTSLPKEILPALQTGHLKYSYKGIKTLKCPFDLTLYTLLLWNAKPRTIFEIGSFNGGSALWLADQGYPVKLNVVCMEGVNDDEIVDFARFGRERGVEVRFIEFMPLDGGHTWERAAVVPGERIVATIGEVFPLRACARDHEPAALWEYEDGQGRVGVIPSVTEPFCATCDRVRLTAEGRLRACLFSLEETDLRALLRGGASDDDLAAAMATCVAGKWAGHGIGTVTFVQPPRSMSQIGG